MGSNVQLPRAVSSTVSWELLVGARELSRSSSEPPHDERGDHTNCDEKLSFRGGVEGILRDFQPQTKSGPATFVVQLVVHARLQIVGIDGFKVVALSRSVGRRQRRQAIRRIDGPIHELRREASVIGGRPRRHDEQRDDQERPPL